MPIKPLFNIFCVLAFLPLAWSCSCNNDRQEPSAEEIVIDTIPQMVMQIQQCSRLYTTEVKVHKDGDIKNKGLLCPTG